MTATLLMAAAIFAVLGAMITLDPNGSGAHKLARLGLAALGLVLAQLATEATS